MPTAQETLIEVRKLAAQASTRYGEHIKSITPAMLNAVLDGTRPATVERMQQRARG